MESMDLLLKN